MAQTYDDLKKKTVSQLREMASILEHEAVKGYTQLNKEPLLDALCKAMGIKKHAQHQVVGLNKEAIKSRIKKLKQERDEALASKNKKAHKHAIRMIHRLKRKIHNATV